VVKSDRSRGNSPQQPRLRMYARVHKRASPGFLQVGHRESSERVSRSIFQFQRSLSCLWSYQAAEKPY